ncbi:mtDNA inheritance, partitioning of the mitochondrial organelle [Tulasnella sp. 332]|nr:mtDNA inheritance, partitioning of the mitochondrial organelle [Tulasnella sp. 332]
MDAVGMTLVVQPQIEPSAYQEAVDDEFQKADEPVELKTAQAPQAVRYWSDYNRLCWSPRTVHPVYWSSCGAESVRSVGRQMFDQLESEKNATEDSLRLFVEECDLMQGFQVSFDTTTFGAFTTKLLECMYEDYPKTPIMSIVNLSEALLPAFDDVDTQEALKVIGDAYILRDLSITLSSLTIPLQSPLVWSLPITNSSLNLDTSSLYHTSALLSAHIESVTIPCRARYDPTDICTLTNQLNLGGDTRIAQLSGFLPVPNEPKTIVDPYNFSALPEVLPKSPWSVGPRFSQRSVIRMDLPSDIPNVSQRIAAESESAGLHKSLLRVSSYPAYPTPSSYPQILRSNSGDNQKRNMSLASSLFTTSTTSQAIASYAKYVSAYVKRGDLSLEVWEGIGKDELHQLSEDLIKIREAYSTDNNDSENDDGIGDEEFELDL